jgi:m7GpppX diphosphatase
LTGTVIVLNDLAKEKVFCKQVREETYDEYKEIIKTRDFSKDIWIWNIVNGISEQNDILYRCNDFLIILNYTWNKKDMTNLHVLAIPSDSSLYTIRSLREKHVDLLKEMKTMTLKMIETTYGLKEGQLKIYFHYAPQTYHLHIHFAALTNDEAYSSVAYSYDLDSVIFNLQLCSKYYKLFNIKKRI